MNEEQKKELINLQYDKDLHFPTELYIIINKFIEKAKREERERIINELQKLPVWQFDSTPYLEEFIQELKTNQK